MRMKERGGEKERKRERGCVNLCEVREGEDVGDEEG